MAPPKRSPPPQEVSSKSPDGSQGEAALAPVARAQSLQGPVREPETLPEHLRSSRDRVYESVMRGGGEPFGEPFTFGLSSLTAWAVRKIKQRGFFGFETLERPDPTRTHGNKFTRYGAAPYQGDHANKRKPR